MAEGKAAPAGRVAAKSGKKKRAEGKRSSSTDLESATGAGSDEFGDTPAVPVLEGSEPSECAEAFYADFYSQRKPCVISDVASQWPAATQWNFSGLQAVLKEHGQSKEMLDIVTYNEGEYEIQRLPGLEDFLDLLYQGSVGNGARQAAKGGPKGSIYSATLRRHGMDVPRKAVEESCPVPQVLQELHASKKLRLRDLSGRTTTKVSPAAKGPFGLCHTNPMGHAGFFVQVKGSATYLIYGPDALPLKRERSFPDAVPEDFNNPKVRAKYQGTVARLNEGDMLFLPPYSHFTMRSEGSWNVTMDLLCLPDEAWAAAGQTAAALGEAASLLGGRNLLCYTLPFALPDETLAKQIQEGLLAATFGSDASMVVRVMVARGGKVAEGLRAAPLCASATSLSELLLECAITSEAAFMTPKDCLVGLALLAYQQNVKGEAAKSELAMNIGSLQTAAWTTIASGQPLTPRPEFRESPENAYGLMVPEALDTAAQLWRGTKNGKRSPTKKNAADADAQVERIVSAMARAFDDMLAAVQAGARKMEETGSSGLSEEEIVQLRTSDGRPLGASMLEMPIGTPDVPSSQVAVKPEDRPAAPAAVDTAAGAPGSSAAAEQQQTPSKGAPPSSSMLSYFDLGLGTSTATTSGVLLAGAALACAAAGGLAYLRMSSSARGGGSA